MARKRRQPRRPAAPAVLLCIRNALFGCILTAALVLLLAISMKWEILSVDAIDTCNTAIKALAACFVGALVSRGAGRDEKGRGWLAAGLCGMLCMAVSFALFAILGGGFTLRMGTVYDLLMAFACAACTRILLGLLPKREPPKKAAPAPHA